MLLRLWRIDLGPATPHQLQQQLQHENGSFDPGDQPPLMVSVVCPEGVLPGMDIIVEGPDGRDVVVQVPSGVAAGDEFTVEVGAAGGLVSVSSAQKMTVTVPEGSSGGAMRRKASAAVPTGCADAAA